MSHPGNTLPSKAQWRTRLRAGRAAVSSEQHAQDAHELANCLVSSEIVRSARTLCCYVPVGSEPGSPELLERLRRAGAQVLLPVVDDDSLDWARYDGYDSLGTGAYGLSEPTGPRLGAAAIGSAQVVLLPALAVDRAGTRLGRGAGYYDRALRLADPAAVLIAVVRDEELVTELPADPHDIPVTWAVTPGNGLVRLG